MAALMIFMKLSALPFIPYDKLPTNVFKYIFANTTAPDIAYFIGAIITNFAIVFGSCIFVTEQKRFRDPIYKIAFPMAMIYFLLAM